MHSLYTLAPLVFSAALFCATPAAQAQDLPTKQPNLLSILREQVKVGHNAAHARHEQGWPAAFEKAKHPYYYLALTSITGPNEAWYIIPYESYEKMGDDFKRIDDDPVLTAEMDRLALGDADHVSSVTALHAVARRDLSYGEFPDLAQVRLYEITIYNVRPGRERDFDDAAKAYVAARKRAGQKGGFRTYQVLAGMSAPSYVVISSSKDFAEMDNGAEEHSKTMASATDEEKAAMSKGMKEAVLKEETNRYRVDPKQSYVSKETKDKAPDFWQPK